MGVIVVLITHFG